MKDTNMKTIYSELCCVCLSSERKILPISDVLMKECLSILVNDSKFDMKNSEALEVLHLCWKCEAYARKFVKFKQQARQSYLSLTSNHSENVKVKSSNESLIISKTVVLTISPDNQSDEESFQVLNLNEPIKEEYLNLEEREYSDAYSDSDNALLIEVSKKNKVKKQLNRNPKKLFEEVQLTDEEVLAERLNAEKSDDYVNAMFRCAKCIITFPNEDDLKEHVQKKHELHGSKHRCSICECAFVSEMSLSYHRGRHRRRYRCTACGAAAHSKRAANKHYDITHCHSETYELEKLQNGPKSKPEPEREEYDKCESYPCGMCEKSFRWKTSLRKHMETHKIENGEKRKPYCEPCKLTFTTTCNLQKHVKTSSKHQIQLKLRKLQECQKEVVCKEALSQQVARIRVSVNAAREVFACPQCDRRFQWRGNLLRHLHTHTLKAKGELVCAPCNRSFSSIATYKQHMQISKKHATENDYKYMCSDCGKRFANKTKLKDHVDWEHLKNYVHTCSECQKIFKSHTSLYLHRQVVHKKVNAEHLCHHCGKSFPNRSKLRGHVTALHSGSAPFACGACSARFSWHSCLSRHVRRVHAHTPPT